MTTSRSFRSLAALSAVAAVALTLASCGGSDSRSSDSSAKASPTSVMVPSMQVKAGTALAQTKGSTDATLSIEPCKLVVTQDKNEKSASGIGSNVGGKYRYTVTTTDKATFEPEEFQLLVALKNNGKSAMNYSDSVQIEYLLNGKPASHRFDTEGVSMSDVPAGGTAFYRLRGPEISSLKEGDTLVVTFHNISVKPGKGADAKTDLAWELTVIPQKTVELKTSSTTEWR